MKRVIIAAGLLVLASFNASAKDKAPTRSIASVDRTDLMGRVRGCIKSSLDICAKNLVESFDDHGVDRVRIRYSRGAYEPVFNCADYFQEKELEKLLLSQTRVVGIKNLQELRDFVWLIREVNPKIVVNYDTCGHGSASDTIGESERDFPKIKYIDKYIDKEVQQ